MTKARTHNKVLPKAGGGTDFYDTFVLNRRLVFQINSCAEMPHLPQYPKTLVESVRTTHKLKIPQQTE